MTIITRQTHPDHHTVGHFFTSFHNVYYCDSYDPDCGYWMTNINEMLDRRNVSERAIGRTYHEVYKRDRLGITEAVASEVERAYHSEEEIHGT